MIDSRIPEGGKDVNYPHTLSRFYWKPVSYVDLCRCLRYKICVATPKGPFYERLGARLREARRRANVTQAGLAQAIGLSRTSVTNIEKGRQPVLVHVVMQLAAALGVQLTDLLPDKSTDATPLEQAEMQHLDLGEQEWVKRVLTNTSETERPSDEEQVTRLTAPAVSVGATKGKRAPKGRRRRSAASSSREDR
jgi:transcriptional regulator with XRE-family HTH domain